jgi:hypothetical protein
VAALREDYEQPKGEKGREGEESRELVHLDRLDHVGSVLDFELCLLAFGGTRSAFRHGGRELLKIVDYLR